jgi:hypothetical protein
LVGQNDEHVSQNDEYINQYDKLTVVVWELLDHFFSSVAYVWVRGAKTTGPIVKKFVFS